MRRRNQSVWKFGINVGMGVIRVRSGKGEKRATKLPDWESNPGLPRSFLEED